jgi:hypothetical protein
MAIFKGQKNKPVEEDAKPEPRVVQAKDVYMAGRFKIVTLDAITGREVLGTFGLIVCRSYNFDNAFYGLIAQALEVNADAILGYRESVAFHPEGEKYYTCYGTAVRLKPIK